MSRDVIATLSEQIRALKAQIDTQAEMITARNIKILQQARKISALQWAIEQQAARVAKQGKLPAQHTPQWRETALEQE